MNASAALPKVLEKIDADLDKSLERLFAFLRLQSVSTDPAFAGQCQAAAKFVADDLASLGFDAQVRKTPGPSGGGWKVAERIGAARPVLRSL